MERLKRVGFKLSKRVDHDTFRLPVSSRVVREPGGGVVRIQHEVGQSRSRQGVFETRNGELLRVERVGSGEVESQAEEARGRREVEVARDGELGGDVDESSAEHVDEDGGESNRVGGVGVGGKKAKDCILDVVFVVLYVEGEEGDGGLVLIGWGRVDGREVEDSEIGG